MSAIRSSCNVLRLSSALRYSSTLPTVHYVVINRFATRVAFKRVYQIKIKNEDIPHKTVQVSNEDGKLEPPVLLEELLSRVDLKKCYVQLVEPDQAIVKVFNKKEEKAKAIGREQALKANRRPIEQKEIQMTWGVAHGDLAHKLGKARKELQKKNRVDLIFAPKSKQPTPPPPERDEKVAEVLEMLKDVGQEWLPRTFKRSLLTIHLRSINQ